MFLSLLETYREGDHDNFFELIEFEPWFLPIIAHSPKLPVLTISGRVGGVDWSKVAGELKITEKALKERMGRLKAKAAALKAKEKPAVFLKASR